MQNTSSMRCAMHGQELSLQRMALPDDGDLGGEVVDAGSV